MAGVVGVGAAGGAVVDHALTLANLGTGYFTEHIPRRAEMVLRMLVALALTWSIGFERELRGAPAGDRTFGMVGVGSAVIGYLAIIGDAPNALAGVVTGIGFLGAGLIIHGGSTIRGVTTAATIFVAAAVGAAAGQGQFLLAIVCTTMTLLVLEIRHVRWMRWADGRHWAQRFGATSDAQMYADDEDDHTAS